MSLDVCETENFQGDCKYRNERFCKTRPRELLQDLYDTELEKFTTGTNTEGTMWALQNAAEIDAENVLQNEPEVAYNIAKLLLDLKRPELALSYIGPVVMNGSTNLRQEMINLNWVTSILAGQEVAGISQASAKREPSEYRTAYLKLHPPEANHKPTLFPPLNLEDEQKAKSLDAWLFIRRYRHLLGRGEFEQFIAEHRALKEVGESTDFLDKWKRAVVVDFLQRAAAIREDKNSGPETRSTIGRFLARSDLFEAEELKEAKVDPPFSWWNLRSLLYALLSLIAVAFVLAYAWLLDAYRSTFISAYDRDRQARAGT